MAFVRMFDAAVAPARPASILRDASGAWPKTAPASSLPSGLLARVTLSSSPVITVDVALAAGDQVFGFGAGAVGAPTRNGQHLLLLNRDTIFYGIPDATYASFPLAWVRAGDGGLVFAVLVLSALPFDVVVDAADGRPGRLRFTALGQTKKHSVADVVVLSGSPAGILADLAALTGRSFIPPAWAMGFHQSRWSYRTAHEVLRVAKRFREEEIPVDVLHLDIHYMDEYRVFTWHPKRFPDPQQLHDALRGQGVRTLAIVDPGIAVANAAVVDELKGLDGLLQRSTGEAYVGQVWPGETVFPDFGQPGVSTAWARFHDVLTQAGVAGFWNDMNDPVLKVGVVYDPLAEDVVHKDGAHVEKRNLFANEMAASTVQALQAARPDERHFVLTRSACIGIQQHAAVWTGDNFSTWEQLREGLHMIVHLGLCGVPLAGADVGGFGGRRGKYGIVKTKPAPELFVRWLELGALMPFSRVHSVLYGPRQEPWSFNDDVTRLSRTILRRRYRLLPYLLRLAREASLTGLPLWRPLWLQHEVPAAAFAAASTQVMVGDDLLFAPVLDKGAKTRRVWLPKGAWIELANGHVHASAGGADDVVDIAAGLGRSPLFVRGGVPFFSCAGGRNADSALRAALALELLAPSPAGARAALVLDDGVSVAGTWTLTAEARDDDGTLHVAFDVAADGFVPVQTTIEVRVPAAFTEARFTPAGGRAAHVDVEARRLDGEDRDVGVAALSVPLRSGTLVIA